MKKPLKLFLPLISKAINSAIALDPNTVEKLQKLKDKIIVLHVTDLEIDIAILFQGEKIEISDTLLVSPNASISAKSSAFAKIMLCLLQKKPMDFSKVEISKDVNLIQEVKIIIENMSIDLEEKMSYYLGDTLSYKLNELLKNLKNKKSQTIHNLSASLTEYLQEEKNLVPSILEVEDFFEDITKLYQDVDRIEAKIKTFEKK